MRSLLIGLVLVLVGWVTGSSVLVFLGVVLTAVVVFLEKEEKVVYEYVDNKPKHVVIQSKPVETKAPLPNEVLSPVGRAIYDKEVKPLEDKVKKLRVDSLVAKGEVKEKLLKELKDAEKEYEEKLNKVSALPFGVRKEASNPVYSLFKGIGINLSVKIVSKLFDKKDKK